MYSSRGHNFEDEKNLLYHPTSQLQKYRLCICMCITYFSIFTSHGMYSFKDHNLGSAAIHFTEQFL